MATAFTTLWRFVSEGLSLKLNVVENYLKSRFCAFEETNRRAYENTKTADTDGLNPHKMEIEIIEKKIRRLVAKLKKHDINVEVFDHNDIEYGALLGKGGEGEVHKCTVVYNDVPVEAAAKTLLDNTDDAISITLDEIELLCLAHDPIINTTLQVYGISAVPDSDDPEIGHLVIIMEAGIMNALQLYQEEEVPISVTFDLWKRLAAALHMMHNRKIIHHDLKPENILVTAINRDRKGQIEKVFFKVIDLGMGKRVFTEKVVTDDILGTKGYHAPEVLFEDSYDFRADVFMLGVTFCVLLLPTSLLTNKIKLKSFLKSLHDAKAKHLTGKKLFDSAIRPSFEDIQNIPVPIRDMICLMLEKQTKRKISLVNIVHICGDESERLSTSDNDRDALVQLRPCENCQDSGIVSDGRGNGDTRTTRRRSTRTSTRANSVSSSAASSTRSTRKCRAYRELANLLDTSQDVFLSTRTRGATTTTTETTKQQKSRKRRCESTKSTTTSPESRQTRKRLRKSNTPTAIVESGGDGDCARTRNKPKTDYTRFFTMQSGSSEL